MLIKTLFLIALLVSGVMAKERIVSLSPSITEILYGVGAGDEIVATSSCSFYPKKAQKLPVIGGYTNPNIEKILIYAPTLVIGESFNARVLQRVKKFHIKTVQLKLKTINDIQNSIRRIGEVVSKKKEAKKVTAKITKALKDIKKTKHPHSVLIVYGLKEDLRSGIYVAGGDIFFNDIIKLTGNTNAYKQSSIGQPVLNYENIIALNPDQIIILYSHATEPNVNKTRAITNWYKIPTNASKNRKISIVDEDYIYIPSHRVALTIKRLALEMEK